MTENAGKIQVGGRFRKGQSGNPQGKQKGSKNKVTLAAEQLLKGESENICRKLVEEACKGNMQAIKLVLERILPAKKNREIEIDRLTLETTSDAVKAISTITTAVCCGSITPSEGESLSKVVDSFVRAIEAYDLEKRISILEVETKKNV